VVNCFCCLEFLFIYFSTFFLGKVGLKLVKISMLINYNFIFRPFIILRNGRTSMRIFSSFCH
jgi:hypothetical protein